MDANSLNREIEEFIREKDKTGEPYNQKEIDHILQYTGSGGKNTLSEGKVNQLYEFYTPQWLAEKMWELAHYHGYDGSSPVLEPSCAIGNLLINAPKEAKKVGFETNPITARIVKIRIPDIEVHENFFETAFLAPPRFNARVKETWLKSYPFGLVIGNPPYGIHKNLYSGYFKNPNMITTEIFFKYYGLKLLKPGGLLVYLTSSNFLRNGDKYNKPKELIGEIADLVDAYRLPKIFSHSDVPTDILIFRKK